MIKYKVHPASGLNHTTVCWKAQHRSDKVPVTGHRTVSPARDSINVRGTPPSALDPVAYRISRTTSVRHAKVLGTALPIGACQEGPGIPVP
ncbi:hypothetical protein C2E23DRAFT_189406 [Lenzites betulinus]|nr:hypothetical protein C2E23DRAFT_189406 [Lenzites betulinus]